MMARYPIWTEEEHSYLCGLVGDYPFLEVVKRYQAQAKRQGWVFRSENAIKVHITRRIGSRKAVDRNFTYHTLAKILGYNRHRVRTWYRQGRLPAKKVGYLTKITDSALKEFADNYPHLLADADWMGLVFLFGEEKASELKRFPSSVTAPRPVRCLETGVVYRSINEAARHCYLNKVSVRRRAEKRNGFEFVEVA